MSLAQINHNKRIVKIPSFLLYAVVFCTLTTVAMPVNPNKEVSDNILRNLKRGLLSADSVLYYNREDMLQNWVKEAEDLEYSIIFQVIMIVSDLMTSQQTLKEEINVLDQGPRLVEMTAVTLLIDAVLEDTCIWLNDVLNEDEFNCTANELQRLASQIRAQKSVEDIKIALKEYRKLKGLGSCDWIECNIWCQEEFQALSDSEKVLKYILKYNDVGCDEFTTDSDTCALKCASFENQS